MGNPKLVWYLVQLRLPNQFKVIPIDWLPQVPIKVEGIQTHAEFEVMEIVDYKNTYPSPLGIDWAIDN